MADAPRRPPFDLKKDLFDNPRAYSFFQAVRLLRLIAEKVGEGSDEALFQDMLRVRPLLSLSFPGTDVYEVEEVPYRDGVRFILTATFLGMYGASSPLPTHYTEDLLEEASEDRTVSRDFLDIFSHPFYLHFFQGWSKYRWHIKIIEEEAQDYLERLYCLLGLGEPEFRIVAPGARRLLRYIGLFTQFPRSGAGLRTLLADALNIEELEILEGQLRKVSIPLDQRCLLGLQGSTLGEECYLGEQIDDLMGKFRIRAGPLHEDQFRSLLPIGPGFKDVGRLTSAFLQDPLERELEVILEQKEARTLTLGDPNWSALGWDTWIFSSTHLETEASVIFQLESNVQRRTMFV